MSLPDAPTTAGGSSDAVHDPGLQAERTRLAWSRTALALTVIGALELHPARADLLLVHRIPAVVTMLVALACWIHGGRRYQRVRAALQAGRSIAPRHSTVTLGLLVVIPAATALWSVWI